MICRLQTNSVALPKHIANLYSRTHRQQVRGKGWRERAGRVPDAAGQRYAKVVLEVAAGSHNAVT